MTLTFKNGFALTFTLGFFVAIGAYTYFADTRIAHLYLLSALLHEAGHLLSGLAQHVRLKRLTFSATGICLKSSEPTVFVLLSGVLVNLLIGAFALAFGDFELLAINLLIAGVNLLPFGDTDGKMLLEVFGGVGGSLPHTPYFLL
jgi:hypothetical protein